MYFRFQFLVEDQSGAVFIETIMDKIVSNYPGVEYDCSNFAEAKIEREQAKDAA